MIRTTLSSLLTPRPGGSAVTVRNIDLVARVADLPLDTDDFIRLLPLVKAVDVSERFKDVIRTFPCESGTPAGFRIEMGLAGDGLLTLDLRRDIGFDRNGVPRPTNLLFSADSANPYEIAPIRNILANLTCNPGIIYDLFINNPKANSRGEFKTRDEVMEEIGRILGPGCDISVELNDPFHSSEQQILEEAAHFRDMLSEYRVVIKVPHTGPVSRHNVHDLMKGDKSFPLRYTKGTVEDSIRGHNLALMLQENGYRVNFTLMFEPYQTALALQARPYFINSFIRHRHMQSQFMNGYLAAYKASGQIQFLQQLRDYMLKTDYLSNQDKEQDLLTVLSMAEYELAYRHFGDSEGADGLDGVRHNLRVLQQANLPDTKLILCSMEGESMFRDIDKLLAESEFLNMNGRVVLTAEPGYLARFTSANQVVSYQRRFMNAANGQK